MGIALGYEQLMAASMSALAARLRDEGQRHAEIGDRASACGDPLARLPRLLEASLDPRAQLANGSGSGALGGAYGEHDLDTRVGVDVYAYAPRTGRAAHDIGNLGGVAQR